MLSRYAEGIPSTYYFDEIPSQTKLQPLVLARLTRSEIKLKAETFYML